MVELNYLDNPSIYEPFLQQEKEPPHLMQTTVVTETDGVPLIRFKPFTEMGFIEQGFSTRLGGVSDGIYASMNLTFQRGDDPVHVRRNFDRIGAALEIRPDRMVCSRQTHTDHILTVGRAHLGMGVTREPDFDQIDALITDEPGVCLVTAYADCVPVILADPVRRCIGAAHAGWRGTASDIAGKMAGQMMKEYGSRPEDLVAFVGPSICVDCYEVGSEVARVFTEAFGRGQSRLLLRPGKAPGKYQLNLQMANFFNLRNRAIQARHIYISDLCTCCNPQVFYSHRASQGRRGGLCNFIYIKE